ncbi:hypothetical protein PIIN_03338 [Serendipita indica DSM 11827]|uniref:RFX-type winged-helix domain-containing protein n=1 Tax=Serendipita indica (strain DSM 11827) TaxID=1109443 RepID=G4TDP5_SERID|nr:hypothetical protein PIIN_03338 [Serendipita indica DSM 11827]
MTTAPPYRYAMGNQPGNPRQMGPPQAGPPLDGHEYWFLIPGPNNRMILSLESGLEPDVTWAMKHLLHATASERFLLGKYPALVPALIRYPEWFLEHADEEDGSTWCPNPEFTTNRRFALNSLLIIKNLSMSEENAAILARMERIRTLVFDIMEKCQRPTDSTLEFLLGAIDIFRYTITKWPASPVPEKTKVLVDIVGRSNDRAIMISGWSALHNLLDTFTNVTHVTPESSALNAAIRVLPLHFDQPLSTAALDYILAHVSNPALAKAFLHHPEMPQALKLLTYQLIFDQQKVLEYVKVTVAQPSKTEIAQNNAIGPLELKKEVLDELSALPEPDRVTQWMQRAFEAVPHAEITQVDFWNLYRTAFTSYGPDTMLPATDLIKLVTNVFPSAMPMVSQGANGKPSKFIIKGLERRRAVAEGRTKCHWDRWKCPEPAFETATALYRHVKTHVNSTTVQCLWGSCTHISASPKLFHRHLLTHLPLDLAGPRHPGQVDDVLVPPNSHVDPGVPTARPVPPGPAHIVNYPKATTDPPAGSFSALLIMRILYRTSFVQAEVVLKTDGDHFGFPGIEQPLIEGDTEVAMEDLGYDTLEGQRKGKAAFKGIGGMLSGVIIHDAAIAAWIDEMLDSIKALPLSQ